MAHYAIARPQLFHSNYIHPPNQLDIPLKLHHHHHHPTSNKIYQNLTLSIQTHSSIFPSVLHKLIASTLRSLPNNVGFLPIYMTVSNKLNVFVSGLSYAMELCGFHGRSLDSADQPSPKNSLCNASNASSWAGLVDNVNSLQAMLHTCPGLPHTAMSLVTPVGLEKDGHSVTCCNRAFASCVERCSMP
mmetsp:Transcript_30031/g.54432  ORF Transcript_30031/g.54432 Transcript_30031/m.54432 type:complete len:188 (+) Transcript_30031:38-601(+)